MADKRKLPFNTSALEEELNNPQPDIDEGNAPAGTAGALRPPSAPAAPAEPEYDKAAAPYGVPMTPPNYGFTYDPKWRMPSQMAQLRPHWTSPAWGKLGMNSNKAMEEGKPVHYGREDRRVTLSSEQLFEKYTGFKYRADDFKIPVEWFEHNRPYALWDKTSEMFIQSQSPEEFKVQLLYIASNGGLDHDHEQDRVQLYTAEQIKLALMGEEKALAADDIDTATEYFDMAREMMDQNRKAGSITSKQYDDFVTRRKTLEDIQAETGFTLGLVGNTRTPQTKYMTTADYLQWAKTNDKATPVKQWQLEAGLRKFRGTYEKMLYAYNKAQAKVRTKQAGETPISDEFKRLIGSPDEVKPIPENWWDLTELPDEYKGMSGITNPSQYKAAIDKVAADLGKEMTTKLPSGYQAKVLIDYLTGEYRIEILSYDGNMAIDYEGKDGKVVSDYEIEEFQKKEHGDFAQQMREVAAKAPKFTKALMAQLGYTPQQADAWIQDSAPQPSNLIASKIEQITKDPDPITQSIGQEMRAATDQDKPYSKWDEFWSAFKPYMDVKGTPYGREPAGAVEMFISIVDKVLGSSISERDKKAALGMLQAQLGSTVAGAFDNILFGHVFKATQYAVSNFYTTKPYELYSGAKFMDLDAKQWNELLYVPGLIGGEEVALGRAAKIGVKQWVVRQAAMKPLNVTQFLERQFATRTTNVNELIQRVIGAKMAGVNDDLIARAIATRADELGVNPQAVMDDADKWIGNSHIEQVSPDEFVAPPTPVEVKPGEPYTPAPHITGEDGVTYRVDTVTYKKAEPGDPVDYVDNQTGQVYTKRTSDEVINSPEFKQKAKQSVGLDAATPPKEPVKPAAGAEAKPSTPKTAKGREGEKGAITFGSPEPDLTTSRGRILNTMDTEPESLGKKLQSLDVKDKLDAAYTHVVDKHYAVSDFVKRVEKAGYRVAAEENPDYAIRALAGLPGKVNAFFKYGTLGRNSVTVGAGGRVSIQYAGESLESILKPVVNDIDDLRIYLKSKHAIDLDGRGIQTGIDMTDASAEVARIEAANPEIVNTSRKLRDYQRQVVDYAYDGGLLTGEQRDVLNTLYEHYVPFKRVVDEQSGVARKGVVNVANPIKGIKGSELKTLDPLAGIMENTITIVEATERNKVGQMFANLAEANPEAAEMFTRARPKMMGIAEDVDLARVLGIDPDDLANMGITEDMQKQVVNVFRPSVIQDSNIVKVVRKGKTEYYEVEPELAKALKSMNDTDVNVLVKAGSYPAKWLRAGAILDPNFWLFKNPFRDMETAFLQSKVSWIPGQNFVEGLIDLIAKPDVVKAWKISGGERSMLVSLDREALKANVGDLLATKGEKAANILKHPLEALEIMSEWTESINRLGEFSLNLKAGKGLSEAVDASRQITTDFSRLGASTKSVNMMVAFWNANIQSMDKLVRTFKERPVQTTAKAILGITIPSMLLWWANKDDERYKGLNQIEKDLNWIICTPDNLYKIPKPFFPGVVFGSLSERAMDYIYNQDPDAIEKWAYNALGQATPDFLPTMAKPWIENMTGYDFFKGQKLTPQGLENLPTEMQYKTSTSGVARVAGKAIADTGLGETLKKWGMGTPIQIDNFLQDYFAGLGRYAVKAADFALEQKGDIAPKPAPMLADYPAAGAVVVRDPYGVSNTAQSDFYDLMDKYTQHEKRLKDYIDKDDPKGFKTYLSEHPEAMLRIDIQSGKPYSATARFLRSVSGEYLNKLRDMQQKIYESKTLTPDEKRKQIDDISRNMAKISTLALQAVRDGKIDKSLIK